MLSAALPAAQPRVRIRQLIRSAVCRETGRLLDSLLVAASGIPAAAHAGRRARTGGRSSSRAERDAHAALPKRPHAVRPLDRHMARSLGGRHVTNRDCSTGTGMSGPSRKRHTALTPAPSAPSRHTRAAARTSGCGTLPALFGRVPHPLGADRFPGGNFGGDGSSCRTSCRCAPACRVARRGSDAGHESPGARFHQRGGQAS